MPEQEEFTPLMRNSGELMELDSSDEEKSDWCAPEFNGVLFGVARDCGGTLLGTLGCSRALARPTCPGCALKGGPTSL